jgi:hypothetical protein
MHIMDVHKEITLSSHPLPLLPFDSWESTEQRLEELCVSHGEMAQEGDRFLVDRLQQMVHLEGLRYPDIAYIDYILTRTSNGWSHHVSMYITESPYDYTYDMFEMRAY